MPRGGIRAGAAWLTGIAVRLGLGSVSPVSGSPRAAVGACVASDLVASVTLQQAGAGNGVVTVPATDVGTVACRLGDYPLLRGVRAGHEYPS